MIAGKPQSLVFDLSEEGARITRRAAAALNLRVEELAGGVFRVHLNRTIDAYELANQTAHDPAWARAFMERD